MDSRNGGWQPIATAPKDGRSALIAEFCFGRWLVLEAVYNSRKRHWYAPGDTGDDEFSQPYDPSHWMPLPPAPEPSNG